jgi:hypothetical protein
MATYLWSINDLNVYDDKELKDIIHSVKYTCTNTENSNSITGSAILRYPQATLTPISNVTEEQAKAWLFDAIGTENRTGIESSLDRVNKEPTKPNWLSN